MSAGDARLASLRSELAAHCAQRDLSPAARADLDRLLATGTEAEFDDVLSHLRRVPVVRREDIHADAAVADRLDELMRGHRERVSLHRDRLAREARHLGAEVARGRVTVAAAHRRLDALACELDPGAPVPIALLPWREALATVEQAFAVGVRRARKGAA